MSKIINRHGNFTLVPNGFIEAALSHETFRLYVVLLSYAKGSAMDGGDVFPSYDTLKDKARVQSYSTIARSLRTLEDLGWLERKKRFGASTIYTLTSPTPCVVMHSAPVLHGVESSPTPGVGQSYTPSKTNKTQVTRPIKQDPVKRRSNAPPATHLHGQLFTAISELCLLDSSAKPNAARIGRVAAWLAGKPGIQCDHLAQFGAWFASNDWRGQKGEKPTPEQVQSEWAKFAAGYKPKPSRNGKTFQRGQAIYTPEMRAAKEREAARALEEGEE